MVDLLAIKLEDQQTFHSRLRKPVDTYRGKDARDYEPAISDFSGNIGTGRSDIGHVNGERQMKT
jgi:hypothetical protein